MTDDELIELHKETQASLSRGMNTIQAQLAIEMAICRSWDIDPFDEEAIEIALDVLHAAAWPDPRTRPDRGASCMKGLCLRTTAEQEGCNPNCNPNAVRLSKACCWDARKTKD